MPKYFLKGGKSFQFDNEDMGIVNAYKWRVVQGRVQGYGNKQFVTLARLVMDAPPGLMVDHKDRDPLNNRKSNLRLCNKQQNSANSGKRANNKNKYKGVRQRFNFIMAYISIQGRQHYLGKYSTQEEAARAYDVAATRAFGEFAGLNFPKEGPSEE